MAGIKPRDDKMGPLIVYTGGGKGKTTAALGLAVRAIGYGLKVLMIQFIKGSQFSGEMKGVKRLAPDFELVVAGRGCVEKIADDKIFLKHKAAAKRALQIGRDAIKSGNYDIIILDEINYALKMKLIRLQDVMELIHLKPDNLTLILTGNYAHPKVVEAADLVTEMKEIKHPYKRGVKAKRGIDY